MTSNELVYSQAPLDSRMQYAQTLATAGSLIPTGLHEGGRPSPGKVLLVMETGAMLGLHPVAALQGVHVIEGKATLSPALMSAVVRRAGHKLRVTTSGSVKEGTFEARAVLIRADDPDNPFEVVWNKDRADRAGLNGRGPWQKYFEAMCKARAISEVCREGATDALMGVGYVPEELGAEVNESGEVLTVAEPPAPRAHAADTRDETPAPVPTPAAAVNEPVATVQRPTRDWVAAADEVATADDARALYAEARSGGQLGQTITVNGQEETVKSFLTRLGKALAEDEATRANPPVADDEVIDAEIVADDGQPSMVWDAADVRDTAAEPNA